MLANSLANYKESKILFRQRDILIGVVERRVPVFYSLR
jgi:hypothetical protein